MVRKPERQTRPQTFYLGADPAALDPMAVDGTRTLSHAQVPDPLPAPGTATARAVYDVPRAKPWGSKIAAYMVTKAVAAGALLAAAGSPWFPQLDGVVLGWISLLFTIITCVLLVSDLHKPKRFYYLLTKPNPRSWLVRGGWILGAHGALSTAWVLGLGAPVLAAVSIPIALATSVYTAFLFRQARGRELWSDDPLLPWTLAVQTLAAAALFGWWYELSPRLLLLTLGAYAVLALLSVKVGAATPQGRHAHQLMVANPIFQVGIVLAVASVLWPPLVLAAFAALDWSFVKAGQEVALS